MDFIHVTVASDGRLPLFPDEAARRRAVRTLVRVSGPVLVLFYLVDEHLHAVWACDRRRAGRLAQGLHAALRPAVARRLEPARLRPVASRSHLEWLVTYVLRQGEHHGLSHHPALWTGSCFQDLVGARDIEGFRLGAPQVLPRLRLREALASVGLPPQRIHPATDEQVFAAGVVRVVAAASAAAAVGPDLAGKGRAVVAAKVASVAVGTAAGLPTSALAQALELTMRSVQKLRGIQPAGRLVEALRRRLALEDIAAQFPMADRPERRPR